VKLPVNRFKAAIREGRPQVGIWSSLCSNVAADVLGTAGFDWALIDMEHSPNELPSVLSQLQAYEVGGTTPIVRPPWNDAVVFKRLLDIGALTLLVPMVQSAAEAEAAVRATRYPPHGIRGVSLTTRTNRYGRITDYLDRVHDEICVLVQVETRAALERIDEIAGVDGVDGVFFGPTDLSADFGHIGKPAHPDVVEAITAAHARVSSAGKPSGILVGDPDQAVHWLKTGFMFVACGSDLALLARGAERLRKHVADGVAQGGGA
jgi:4-hydroxy-2-oxoheptanedioate aldolase